MAFVKTGTSDTRAFCDRCGTEIKNIYIHAGNIYGSECILAITGSPVAKNAQVFHTEEEVTAKLAELERWKQEDEEFPF